MKQILPLAAILCAAAPAVGAHPHIFVTASVEVVFEDGRPQSVRMEWVYDALFSLLLTEDLGLDRDADGQLTAQEEAVLAEQVTQWPADYDGALHVSQEGQPLVLSQPVAHSARLVDGRLHESLTREILGAEAHGIDIALFEAAFYTAYEVEAPVMVSGDGAETCEAVLHRPDIVAAQKEVEALIGRKASDVGAEEAFPEVGDRFADRIEITCAR